jgi:hypothetical protein
MQTGQYIKWKVSKNDLLNSPLTYTVELGETSAVSPVSATHNTFNEISPSVGTGNFTVSINGDDNYVSYPVEGLYNATENTVVEFSTNGEMPTSVLLVGNGEFLLKMSLDCNQILQSKQICQIGSYVIVSVSCDSSGNIWVKDSSGVLTVLSQDFRTINTFRMTPSLYAVIDPFRQILWQVDQRKVSMIRTETMETVFEIDLPQPVTAVIDHDISDPSGTVFFVLVSEPYNYGIAVTLSGVLSSFSPNATGICQWGSQGALVASGSATVDIFNGTHVSSTSTIGSINPVRLSSFGYENVIASDLLGNIVMVDSSLAHQLWMATSPFVNPDVHIPWGPMELGRVSFLSSTSGAAAYRDMLASGLPYGSTVTNLVAGNSSLYPVAAIIPPLSYSHICTRITSNFTENSSSST